MVVVFTTSMVVVSVDGLQPAECGRLALYCGDQWSLENNKRMMMMMGGDGDDVRARMQAQMHATRTHTASEVPGLLRIICYTF